MTDVSRIKSRTTTGDVLHAHGLPGARRGPCPIHGGDNRSAFTHDGHRWACFTRCGSGDVVRLVELLRGVGFRDAVAWLENFTGLRRDEPETVPDEFPDIAPHARRAWLESIEQRWNAVREWDPSSAWMDVLEDEWREARRMPGGMTVPEIERLMNEIATILWEGRG